MTSHTSYVDGTPTSEVTPVTIRYICPPHYGHTSLYHGHEWMTHILFVPCQSAIPFLRYSYFRLWPWIFNSRVNVMGVVKGQGHTIGPVSYQFTSFSFHINQTNNSWDRAISKFYLATSKVKVMSEVKGQKVTYCTQYPTDALPFRFTSIRPSIPEIWPKYTSETFKRKFAKITVSNRTSPKSNQVITMTRAIMLPCFVVIRQVVLTLSCRQANFC